MVSLYLFYRSSVSTPVNMSLSERIGIFLSSFSSGEYATNQCKFGDSSCVPCQDKLPSCKGLPDGINPVPGKLWTDLYIQCLKNRTLVVEHCKVGIFDPTVKKCIENVDPSEYLPSYHSKLIHVVLLGNRNGFESASKS